MTTPLGTRLTLRHRQMQLELRSKLLKDLAVLWRAFDIADVDNTWNSLEDQVLSLIERYRGQSAILSSIYYRSFRAVEGITTPLPLVPAGADRWRERARVSLRVTGPISAKSAIAAKRPRIKETAFVRVSGVASRYALDGGREAILRYIRAE